MKQCIRARCNSPAMDRSNYCGAHQLTLQPREIRGTRGEKFVFFIAVMAGLLLAAVIKACGLL